MWGKTWRIAEGFCIGGGLFFIGLVLQLCVGNINWDNFAWPLNIYILVTYLTILVLLYTLRQRIYFVRWSMSYNAALPALTFVVIMTFMMGLIRQVPAASFSTDVFGFSKMISCWPFVLLYWWMTTILGLISIKHLCSFKLSKIPFLCNHLGLFIALVCAVLGSADMQRLKMHTQVGKPEWRAIDESGNVHELPLAVELKDFMIDEYPPKLMLIDNSTGAMLPANKPEHLLIEDDVTEGRLCDWNIKIIDKLDKAASVVESDSVKFVEWQSVGAASAVCVEAISPDTRNVVKGWVSCGSFAFPYHAMRLDSLCSLIMPDREPRRYTSRVKIYTQSGKEIETEIEVNKPVEVEGWKIYQLSYDETKGRWSDISVFELVTDVWLEWVYAGIIMMIIGAISMFVLSHKVVKEG